MPELLAPAGSLEGVRAAVQSGADAVYFGFGTFNARRGAKNFTREEMAEAIAYCRTRGVKTNVTFNIVATDRERQAALEDVRFLNEAGADALIVQDLGLAAAIRACAPDLPLHASTQMTIHTLDGARMAAALGFSRVVLSRECTLEQIQEITAHAGIETEVFVHGALCMCYSGQCYLSSVIGQRSGNRGLCAQPCRLPYRYDGDKKTKYALSLRDLCLAGHLAPLVDAGVTSFKIEGRMKRPAYAAVVTEIYARLLRERRRPTPEEADALRRVFSRDGFTDGYLTGKKGDGMFGVKTDLPLSQVQDLYDEAERRFAPGREAPRVPVSVSFKADETGLILNLWDGETDGVTALDSAPVERAHNRPATEESVRKSLEKLGGTPLFAKEMSIQLEDGLMLPASRLNALRRQAVDRLLAQRGTPPRRRWQAGERPAAPKVRAGGFQGYTVQVQTLSQLTPDLLAQAPAALYVPVQALAEQPARAGELLGGAIPVAAVLPRIVSDEELPALEQQLLSLREQGLSAVLCGNLGQIKLAKRLSFAAYGDFGLNICNSEALHAAAACGVTRQTLSFELRLAQLRDLEKPVETELLIYGYLPLMIFENCAIRRRTGACTCRKGETALTDRTGKRFRLLPLPGCRNELINSQPLWLGDRRQEYERTGVSFARLRFTVESPERCAELLRACRTGGAPDFPEGMTRGLYDRGMQ